MSADSPVIDALCRLLETGDEADRCYAARALGSAGDPAAVPPLLERLRDEDIDVCVDAAEALGRIGSAEAVPALVESLSNDPSGEVCTAITQALGRIGGSEAAGALRRVAEERPAEIEWNDDWDTWWDVQREAVIALGRFRDPAAVPALIRILEDETQQDIESEIVTALARIPEGGVSYLIDRLGDTGRLPQHRRRAAQALAGAGTESEAVTRALGQALKDPAPEVRAAAVRALAQQGARRYLRALLLLLRDPDAEVREAALSAVIQLDRNLGNGADSELLALADDPDSRVRASLFNLLLSSGGTLSLTEEMREKVEASLDDAHAETAAAACALLGHSGDPQAVPALLSLLGDRQRHPMVRREAALGIGRLGATGNDVLDTLSRAVTDPEQAIRLAALSALMMLDASAETRAAPAEAGDGARTPLQIVVTAMQGEIEIGDGEDGGTGPETETGSTTETTPPVTARTGRDLLKQAPPPPVEPLVEETPALPERPARIVEEGEVEAARSTLDAIAMDNVEMMLAPEPAPETPEPDAETQEYLQVVEDNIELMQRIRSNRRIDTHQDIRRLGARILAGSDRREALEALIAALNDDDELLRQEAAEAVGSIAERNRERGELMDAVGILITQLAVGGRDLKAVCADSLGRLGNQAAVIPLLEAVQDSEANVRIRAAEALGRLACDGIDPVAADHMVVRRLPPLSIARRLMERLEDPDAGVRLALVRALGRILGTLDEKAFQQQAVTAIVDSVFQWTGEEARLVGRELTAFDRDTVTGELLSRLERADDSSRRSVIVEMLEELIKSRSGQPGQAA